MQLNENGITSSLMMIPSGRDGIIETMRQMRRFVREYKKNMQIRSLAMQIVSDVENKRWAEEAKALFHFVRRNIRFTRDINGVETIQTPLVTLQLGQGDCDDHSILLASLMESIGHPTRFIAVGFEPDVYEHVFVESKIGAEWTPFDTTEKHNPGWFPPGVQAKLIMYN
jgi:transglutaminase-like putative cysteine protease